MKANPQRRKEGGSVIVGAVASAEKRAAEPAGPEAPAGPVESAATGQVRFTELARSGFFGPEADDPRLLAEIRHLKRAIIRGAFGAVAEGLANVVAVTSALPEAGKTYLAASIAQALTLERDRSALLIDGDDVRCTLSKSLGQFGKPGFFDVLHDRATASPAVTLPTDLAGLSFMPVGGRFSDSLEMLTSKRAVEVVDALSKADPNRLVIIDCPPLLGTPNGAALAALAGQTLVIVEAGVTDTATLTKALELLGKERPVGLVMNKVPRSKLLYSGTGSYYYYGSRD
jgi:receptor protein-tyrosine kinase